MCILSTEYLFFCARHLQTSVTYCLCLIGVLHKVISEADVGDVGKFTAIVKLKQLHQLSRSEIESDILVQFQVSD